MCSKKYCDCGEELLHGPEGSLYTRFDDFKVDSTIDNLLERMVELVLISFKLFLVLLQAMVVNRWVSST